MPSVITLSIKARFYASVIPLNTTTAVVQSHRRKNSENRYVRSLFFGFFLDEKESLKGITVFVGRLAGCLHTSRITTNGDNTLTSVSFSARLRLSKSKTELAPVMPSVSRLDKVKGFQGFCSNNPLNFC